MVEAGEASGGLAEILGKVAGYFESTVKLTKKVKSAMTYPIAVIGLAVALVNVLLIFVIPVFADMFKDFGAKLPAPTQFLIDLSNFLKACCGFYLAAACYGVYWAVGKFIATPKGRRAKDQFLVKAPIFGNFDPQDRAVPVLPHLRDPDPFGRADLAHPRDRRLGQRHRPDRGCLRRRSPSTSAKAARFPKFWPSNEFFPPMMKHMVKAGEATGNVDGMMNKIADFYDVECDGHGRRAHLPDRAHPRSFSSASWSVASSWRCSSRSSNWAPLPVGSSNPLAPAGMTPHAAD